MMRISYSRMFWGGTIVNAALFFMILAPMVLIALLSNEEFEGDGDYSILIFLIMAILIFLIMAFIGSPVSGLLCMLVLSLFGKREEVSYVNGVSKDKEKVIYVIKDEQKDI